MKIMLNQDSLLTENGYSIEEQEEIYDEQLRDVLTHTRWYLDNLDSMKPYKVAWKNYRYKTATIPHSYSRK